MTNDLGNTRDRLLVLAAGVLYLASAAAAPQIYQHWFRIPSVVQYAQLQHVVISYQLAGYALAAPPVLLICVALLKQPAGPLRAAWGGISLTTGCLLLVGIAAVSIILDLVNLWPFTWRAAQNTTPIHLASLVGHRNWVGFTLLAAKSVLLVPMLEEVIFRFGVLRGVARLTHSTHVGVLISAILFALLHLSLSPDGTVVLNALWLFFFSIVLGYVTDARQGRLGIAIASHAARNLIELVTMTFFVVQRI